MDLCRTGGGGGFGEPTAVIEELAATAQAALSSWSRTVDPRLLPIAVGALLLLFGCRLYFVLLGAAGFVAGWWLAQFLQVSGPWSWVLALVLGALFSALSFTFHRIALAVVGSLLGGLAGVFVLMSDSVVLGAWSWLVIVVAAILGALLMATVFRLALTVISAAYGAALILQYAPLADHLRLPVWLATAVIGALFQWFSRARSKRRRRERRQGRRLRRAALR